MAEPFIGEIKVVSFNFAPRGWALCNGQLLTILQNQALFSLLGVMYGGNGQTTFALPNLQGRIPVHVGGPHSVQGEAYGAENVTLQQTQLPAHSHTANCNSGAGTSAGPVGKVWSANSKGYLAYKNGTSGGTFAPGAIANTGGSQPHYNMAPYLCLNFVIALTGIFPARS